MLRWVNGFLSPKENLRVIRKLLTLMKHRVPELAHVSLKFNEGAGPHLPGPDDGRAAALHSKKGLFMGLFPIMQE
jgi:hypothetical protein